MKSWQNAAVFGVCLAVVLAAMAWISAVALKLERAQSEAEKQARRQENVRLALWRMDAAVAPLIARENARPYFHYSSFYPAGRAYTRMYRELGPDEVMLPSPLLTLPAPMVLLHFQVDPDGSIRSPQVPDGRLRALAESTYGIAGKISDSASMLLEIGGKLKGLDPVSFQPLDRPAQPRAPAGGTAAADEHRAADPLLAEETRRQSARNESEWNVRMSQQAAQQEQVLQANVMAPAAALKQRRDGSAEDAVAEGVMRPLWAGDALVLARRITVDGRSYVQGCWLDWPAIRKDLLAQIPDLFELTDLRPEPAAGADSRTMLAALPARLVPGRALNQPPPRPSAIRLSLAVAWGCVLAAAAAFGALLAGIISLSERRAAFVSSVTHELRTPLTTFRLYTDMLAGDMVPDPGKRRSYLQSMGAEADRLAHLVENVLAYSRVERGRAAAPAAETTAGALLDAVRERLAQRAAQAGMEICVEGRREAMELRLVTDRSAVEQILFNLVDNACKYACGAADRRIHVMLFAGRGCAVLRVRDHGPGISASDRRSLFRPFSKSAQRAANSAPGVGLGLALSRRLARHLGGSLEYGPAPDGGAVFDLRLASLHAGARIAK